MASHHWLQTLSSGLSPCPFLLSRGFCPCTASVGAGGVTGIIWSPWLTLCLEQWTAQREKAYHWASRSAARSQRSGWRRGGTSEWLHRDKHLYLPGQQRPQLYPRWHSLPAFRPQVWPKVSLWGEERPSFPRGRAARHARLPEIPSGNRKLPLVCLLGQSLGGRQGSLCLDWGAEGPGDWLLALLLSSSASFLSQGGSYCFHQVLSLHVTPSAFCGASSQSLRKLSVSSKLKCNDGFLS